MSEGQGVRPDELDRALLGGGRGDSPSAEPNPSLAMGSPGATARPAERAARQEPAARPPVVPADSLPEPGGGDGSAPIRVGIAGGKGVGKSYLFQAMVYRTQAGEFSGALASFLERGSIDLASFTAGGEWRRENLEDFLRSYESWLRLEATPREVQRWYRLRLGYRSGVLGQRRSALELEFLDGSGEGFFEAPLSADNLEVWRRGFLDLEVMVFCLPLWVAFPRGDLADVEWEDRELRLSGFQRVIGNFQQVRKEYGADRPVTTVLALTMADDGRSALDTLRRCWIEPYVAKPERTLAALRRGVGAARYLLNARRVSEALGREFRAAPEMRVKRLPNQLAAVGVGGAPWLIPLSAVDGALLALREGSEESQALLRRVPPVPVHVELPLLVALCERANALM